MGLQAQNLDIASISKGPHEGIRAAIGERSWMTDDRCRMADGACMEGKGKRDEGKVQICFVSCRKSGARNSVSLPCPQRSW